MTGAGRHVVTGAFGYSGRFIARRLLAAGHDVATLTNSPNRPHDLGDRVAAHPLAFDDPQRLRAALEGCDVLYNTWWIRFEHGGGTFPWAIECSGRLFEAAARAGVRRIVHVSITNPDERSPFAYFQGKAVVERMLADTGISCAVLRPAVLFGGPDILVNNIAWSLRHLPAVGLLGDGTARLRPVHVDDLAALAVEQGQRDEDVVLDAVGPETFTYRGLVEALRDQMGVRRAIVSVPPWAGYAGARMLGLFLRDVMLTPEEIGALLADRLVTEGPATGATSLRDWAATHAETLGRRYASELARRRDREQAYE